MRRRNLPSGSWKSAKVISCETISTKILTEPNYNPKTFELRYAMRTCLGTARSRTSDGSVCTSSISFPHSDQLLNTYLSLVSHTPVPSLLVYSIVQKNPNNFCKDISAHDDHLLPHSLIQWTKDRRVNSILQDFFTQPCTLRRGNHVHPLKEARAMVMPRGYSISVAVRMVSLMSELPGVGFHYGVIRQNFPEKMPILDREDSNNIVTS